ncbi:hypothetical protein AUEXF2481DRAFT_41971 [Aureobasidium subglaciale EXF-2481]|uniref:Inositol-1-monophosphatase n=1 Tax=Aureobasidium subglaciale (strain EXF-2481) TaxID=1043005 RepID=A0A074YGN4_AURSE|nr:uncharacterized protein AUEXF2481DRAFT_41971 [Aureobasidium subglaciale EXF-2481]KAI5194012.1 inositol monophosphatase [Aureobasidium subglaciale]KAI5213442.1 inositol monophosphatase [Aureobasidium subglaciale]KAI5214966.1 inositol monophosphatase [Aureobasidium subglaciale]KAI5252996.1 inositol monophosphatase [Aureobasidium subglaciale]KEQ93247.1 hypothetical protein AUEXF2481DRAFT_41971 [Aureobasidium subglaciale EXF-2481]
MDLDAILEDLVAVARQGGWIISSSVPSASGVESKKSSADLVTEIDRVVERTVFGVLRSKYPSFNLIGEESWKHGTSLDDTPTFVVDPVDGTSNYVHGLPDVCISIGLVIKRRSTIGVVYNPFHNELWTAVTGSGAFYQKGFDGERSRLPLKSNSERLSMQTACIGIEWGSDREGPNFDLNLKVFTKLASTQATGGHMVNSLRCTGSAAITICRVAAGQQDMFWECGSWIWDVAAAWCILEESGGMMVDGHPGNWIPKLDGRRYLAVRGAPGGQREIVEDFWAILGEDRSTYGD